MITKLLSEKGFTLIELMVVLAIVSIMMAIMIPNVSGYMSSLTINSAAEGLATDLRSARQLAISKNVKTVITINLLTRQYATYRTAMTGEVLAGTPVSPDGTNNYYPVTMRQLSENSTIGYQTLPIAASSQYVIFNSDGSSTGGTIYLMPDREFLQGVKQKMKQITVMNSTGHIRVSTWLGGKWQ